MSVAGRQSMLELYVEKVGKLASLIAKATAYVG